MITDNHIFPHLGQNNPLYGVNTMYWHGGISSINSHIIFFACNRTIKRGNFFLWSPREKGALAKLFSNRDTKFDTPPFPHRKCLKMGGNSPGGSEFSKLNMTPIWESPFGSTNGRRMFHLRITTADRTKVQAL